MVFTNPWGLLALLSTLVIVGLHFFRSHRQTRVIGGLHLWQFAATRQPIGNRWTRLLPSLSLLAQLLAATLLSLLIAGLDLPRRDVAAHYTIIVDDSASMSAEVEGSPAQRARDALAQWASADAQFTVVAAGARARVLAGPFVDRTELLRKLNDWRPQAPLCDLSQAVQLASRFVSSGEKILLVTDQPDLAEEYVNLVETLGVGKASPNHAIVFADRVRLSPDKDRVFVTLQTFGPGSAVCRVRALVAGQVIYESSADRTLNPGSPESFSFEVNLLDSPIDVELDADALNADNRVVLSPVPVRAIRVHAEPVEPLARYVARAVEATPFAYLEPDPQHADLVFAQASSFPPPLSANDTAAAGGLSEPSFPRAILDHYASSSLICLIPPTDNAAVAGVARGLDILPDTDALITQGLPLEEGIVWPFIATQVPPSCRPVLSTIAAPLLFGGSPPAPRGIHRECYYLNMLADRTNIYQTNCWPVLVRNLIEQTRRVVPGMSRTNYRLGEQVIISLEPEQVDDRGGAELLRDGARYARFADVEQLAEPLADLEVGHYQLIGRDPQPLAEFSVNFFAPAESDLTGAKTVRADLRQLEPGKIARETTDQRLFLVLLTLVIFCTGLAWIFQDSSR